MILDSQALRVAVTLEQCWHRVPGGTARAALDLVTALQNLPTDGGRPFEMVGVSAWHRGAPPDPWNPSISVARMGVPRRLLYELWHRFRWPPVSWATGDVDVIHVTGLAMPPRSVPIVATLHDLAFRRYPDQFTRNGMHFFAGALAAMLRDADVVLCSSQATADDALHAGFAPERLRVVPLGVHMPDINDRDAAVRRAELGVAGRYVLHIGTAEPRKNRVAVVKAVDALPDDVRIVLVGPDGWGDEKLPVDTRRVTALRFVSEADKWALLRGAAAFCYPSLWEGFGLPVLEALAAGTPVVTSAGTSMAEIAGDAALLIDPTDQAALNDALRSVLDDSDAATAARVASGKAVAARYSWEATARLTLAAYREVAAS